jgi:hypothetical protein
MVARLASFLSDFAGVCDLFYLVSVVWVPSNDLD